MKDYQDILFPYAYNILGSAEDAKDAIQDVLSHYVETPREGIENEKNYLIKSVINHAINLRNRRKKVNYGDVWLPEPVATEAADTNINLKDIVSYSLLILLEQLNPKERAVFILKEGFGYSHQEISEVLSGTVELSRKLLSRAKTKLNQSRHPVKLTREPVPSEILEKYVNTIRGGDTERLEDMLAEDITFFADGGGKVNVVKKICTGMHEVADLLVYVFNKYQTDSRTILTTVNHQPAVLFYTPDGKLLSCQVLDISAETGEIVQISSIVDPAKLKNIDEETAR